MNKPRSNLYKPILLLLLISFIGTLLFYLNDQSIDLERMQMIIADVRQWHQQNSAIFAGVFFSVYVIITATSLPLAVWMTLAAGALFGLWGGVLMVSFASSIGATLAFLSSRYFLRDWVRTKLGKYIHTIDAEKISRIMFQFFIVKTPRTQFIKGYFVNLNTNCIILIL